MAKKPSTRTKVADHRSTMPPSLMHENRRKGVAVYLDSSNGQFIIDLPKETHNVLPTSITYVYASTMNEAIRNFDRAIENYGNIIRSADAVKVIFVTYHFNKPYDEGFGGTFQLTTGGYAFDHKPTYAIGLTYEIMHRINNHLYDLCIDDNGSIYGPPQHRKSVEQKDEHRVIEWTEEREQFLSKMCYSMEELIRRMNGFFGKNMLGNMTKAIESGGGLMSLPAPEVTHGN